LTNYWCIPLTFGRQCKRPQSLIGIIDVAIVLDYLIELRYVLAFSGISSL